MDRTTPLPIVRSNLHERRRWHALAAVLTVTGAVLASAPSFAVSFTDVTGTARVNRSGESYGASFGDINGDGYLEIYTSNHRQQDNLYLNLNGKQFYRVSSQVLSWQNHKNADTHGATFADIENDGDQDLFISTGTGNLSMMLFNENQRLVDRAAQKGWTTTSVGGRQPVWLDYNGDKLLDFVMTQMAGNGKVYQQGAGGNFSDMTSIAKFICTNFHYGHLYDANDDGDLDFLCPDQTIFPQRIYEPTAGQWTKIFEAKNTGQTWFPRIPGVVDSVVADFNNDGREDIFLLSNTQLHPSAVVPSGSNYFEALLANGTKGVKFVTGGQITIKPDWNSADKEWEVVDLKRILIGKDGTPPPSINFTLDPANPKWVGEPQKPTDESAYPIMRIWYTPSTQLWTLEVQSKLNSTSSGFSVAYLRVSSTSAISQLQSTNFWPGDSPARPTLLMNRLPVGYFDETVDAGLGKPISCSSATAGDFDNDMRIDLFLACRTGASNLADILYRNVGNGTFQQVASFGAAGPVGVAVASGAGTADSVISGDYDVDGFLDLFVTNGLNLQPRGFGGPSKLFHNNGNSNHWVEVDLVGTQSDRDATGAKVYAIAGGVTQLRVQDGRYHRWSQDAKRAHFGLGGSSTVRLHVEWPNGGSQTHDVAANKLYRITEGGGIAQVPIGVARAYPCGAPTLDGFQDKGVYVWRDCPSGKWILRVLSANTTITYEGTVTSTSNFTSVKPQGLEAGDVLNTSNTKQISFAFISKGTGADGVDFKLPDGANACLKVPVPAGAQFYMGPFKKPILKPTNLETQGPC